MRLHNHVSTSRKGKIMLIKLYAKEILSICLNKFIAFKVFPRLMANMALQVALGAASENASGDPSGQR